MSFTENNNKVMPDTSDRSSPAVGDIEAAANKSKPTSHTAFAAKRTGSCINSTDAPSSSGLPILMRNLSYHVPLNSKRNERAYLLKHISAYLEPGQMTALMGPSGSGKTTLLDLLAGRKTVGKTEGHLSFACVQPTKQFLRRHTGYVEQFDTLQLLGDLTVREMLMYTAELKRSMSEPLAEKQHKVEVLLRRLALETCADIKIGDPLTKGISGGQAKRTNERGECLGRGIALIGSPRVLFLDEPTSGLDSYTANEVMKVVRGLLTDGTTIAATIHSPTPATFALFDRVMLLVRGHLVYFGPRGLRALQFAAEEWPSATAAVQLLALHRFNGNDGAAAALAFNNAEVLIETVTEADQHGEVAALASAYNNSALRKENDRQLELHLVDGRFNSVASNSLRAKGSFRLSAAVLGRVHVRNDAASKAAGKEAGSNEADKEMATAPDAEASGPASRSMTTLLASSPSMGSDLYEQVARELATRSETVTPWYWGLWTLLKYRTQHNYVNLAWLGPRIGDKLAISLVILTLYLGVGDNFAPDNLVNITASLFMWALLPAFGAMSYIPAIVLEGRLFIRERADGLYKVFTYLTAKLLEELILSLVITLVFASYVFYGLQLQGQWVVYWLVYFVDLSVGIALAYLIAALSPNIYVANAALPGFVVTLLFFAGQLMTVDAIPAWWQWYSRIDFLRYAWGALMLNQFESNDVVFVGGKTILEHYGLRGANKWAYIGYLALFWLVFSVLALMALSFLRHQKR